MHPTTSCLLRGIAGVVLGILALVFPEVTKATFFGIFWLLIGLGMAGFLFLAITATGDESMLWFGLSAGLLFMGVLSFFVPGFGAIFFLLIVAATALYNGFADSVLALARPKTGSVLIPGMFLACFFLLGLVTVYLPDFWRDPLLAGSGTFALGFGMFSILMAYYTPPGPADTMPPVQDRHCALPRHDGEGKK